VGGTEVFLWSFDLRDFETWDFVVFSFDFFIWAVYINKVVLRYLFYTALSKFRIVCLGISFRLSWFILGWQQRTTRSLYHPSPWWGGDDNWKKKAKLLGRDRDSLTEQQTNRTVTTAILIRTREYTEQLSLTVQCPVHS